MRPMRYWIGLGSNQGHGPGQIDTALQRLACHRQILVTRRSACYGSAPWGFADQADFTNAVAELETALGPLALLACLQDTEAALGRERGGRRYGPRPIDLDVLLAGEDIYFLEGLTVPHPRMHRRAFVLAPLNEVDPEICIPTRGRVGVLLSRLQDQKVWKLGPAGK